jgi:hypothetical protein
MHWRRVAEKYKNGWSSVNGEAWNGINLKIIKYLGDPKGSILGTWKSIKLAFSNAKCFSFKIKLKPIYNRSKQMIIFLLKLKIYHFILFI